MDSPRRGFPASEFRERVRRLQRLMAESGLAAMLFTTEPEVRYFTGFLTRFWESPTRPWFLVVPSSGDPVAVIPEIGRPLMERTWLRDILTWPSPDPDDDGISLLASALSDAAGQSGAIGIPAGPETHLRLPRNAFEDLARKIAPRRFAHDFHAMRSLRSVKSPMEMEKIAHACEIAGRAFARVHEIAGAGTALSEVFRRFQILCLEEGADWVPYLAGGAGREGYADVISPAGPQTLERGDVLMLDTGLVWDGYFCDFDRNYSVGPAGEKVASAHRSLVLASGEALKAARPGVEVRELHRVMDRAIRGAGQATAPGRLGHEIGMQLTEGLSIMDGGDSTLVSGMALALEPVVEVAEGKIMAHEENVFVTGSGAVMVSPEAPSEIPEI